MKVGKIIWTKISKDLIGLYPKIDVCQKMCWLQEVLGWQELYQDKDSHGEKGSCFSTKIGMTICLKVGKNGCENCPKFALKLCSWQTGIK